MLKEGGLFLRGFIHHRQDRQSNLLSINWEKDGWLDRFMSDTNIHKWQTRAHAILPLLEEVQTRKHFVNETDPATQYAILELVARFTQVEPEKI